MGNIQGVQDGDLANLGIYGVGKRRTIAQLAEFVGIKFSSQQARKNSVSVCEVLNFYFPSSTRTLYLLLCFFIGLA